MNERVSILERTVSPGERECFNTLLNCASENDYAFALWRLPNDQTKNLVLSFSAGPLEPKAVIEDLPAGFIFAPFDKTSNRYLLKADRLFTFSNGTLNDPADAVQTASRQWLNDILPQTSQPAPKNKFHKAVPSAIPANKERYEQLVKKSLDEITRGTFEKVVLSRCNEVELPPSFDVIETFQKLCDAYPNALVSLVSIPTIGTWMGATPELLIQVQNQHIFKTVALAGTKPFEPGMDIRQAAWTQKEIEEQALVCRYIISSFKKIRLREYEEHGPKTIVAGNVMHLQSTFEVDMKETNFPQLGSVMLQLIHPTSAVCGMPLEESLEFLKANEGYNREFYSGYLGPVNINRNICLFVNLRCMQLAAGKAVLYAGAGVTADSVPESEWEETRIKLNTLLNIIRP